MKWEVDGQIEREIKRDQEILREHLSKSQIAHVRIEISFLADQPIGSSFLNAVSRIVNHALALPGLTVKVFRF